MIIKVMFLLFIGVVYGYNIDVEFPLIYSYEDMVKNNDSYFGYTVLLYRDPVNNTSWLLVGAPNAEVLGAAYRCGIENKACREIRPLRVKNEEGYIMQMHRKILIKKQRGWFGSAISIDKLNGILTICAPRTVVSILHPLRDDGTLETMQGMCYSGRVSSNLLLTEDRNLTYHDFKSTFWYNPLHGFSVHYASVKHNEDRELRKLNRVVGQPKHENYGTIYVSYADKNMTIELPLSDELSQFGYSIESGYFFRRDQLLYVSGAPGWNYVGQVGIINPAMNPFVVMKLNGTDIGEFFGASLAVGDLNNDGLDDLLIGAPYWGEDNGKIYIFFGTSKGQFEPAVILQGAAEGGHFGYAIATGDLDADRFDDIIVGAPWEEYGVIYIYNGGPDLKYKNLQASERIDVAKFSQFIASPKIKGFGFSISKPVDIDENGYLDIAVGAYKSGHAVVLRSKPIVKTTLVIQTVPNILQMDTKQFLIKVCPQYSGYNVPSLQKFKITTTIDERYQRTKETVLELDSDLTLDGCLSTQINILKNVRNFIEPISIFAKHDFLYDNASKHFCKLCPVERKNIKLEVAQALLPFNIGCGEDRVCNSNISAIAKFHDVHDNNTWVIGSNDVSLEVNLKNYGEPAFLTTLEFMFPRGVMLRSILPTCQEDISKENLTVICDIGNPIWNGEEKNIKLDLDMRHLINDSVHDDKLNFYATIKTGSVNHGTISITKTLSLINEVSLSLHGKASEELYYLGTSNNVIPNISFQHTYQVYKLGASPIKSAQLIIKVPAAIKNSETLVYTYKPQLYVSGEFFECFSKDTLSDIELIEVEREPSFVIQQNEVHELYKRALNDSITNFYDAKNIKTSQALNKSLANSVIYMNCSTSNVKCTTIECDLNALKTLQDIGQIVIKLFLYVKGFKDNFSDNNIVLKFSTEANVKLIKPATKLDVRGTRSTMEVVTIFYNTPKMEKVQLWIVLISVLVGLVLLLILATVLNMLGFFKRKGKQDLTQMNVKNNEITEKGMTKTDN